LEATLVDDAFMLDREAVWPNLAQTARLLDVDRSTLTKQAHAGHVRHVKLGLGRGQLVVPPAEVLRLAAVYRRVSITEVRRNLAREMAAHTTSSEEAFLHALERLERSSTTTEPPVIDLGRLRPRRVHADDLPPADLLEAIDRRRPRQPRMETSEPDPPVVDLGRLRPVRRS
jgi:hypothetical protein